MISRHELEKFFKENGFPAFRMKQLLHAIYKEGKGDFSTISVLPKNVRGELSKNFSVFSFEVVKEVVSKSGDTVKTLFKLHDGKLVEGVLMRFKDSRNSVCVSSQVGCGLKCAFCATGTMGFFRNLTPAEIADQVLYFDQWLKSHAKPSRGEAKPIRATLRRGSSKNETPPPRVNHVIFMGMGEPMLNYDNVLESIRIMNDPDLLGIAARHITVSTSGVIPGIEKFTKEPMQINLAISIHAADQEVRAKLMPIAKAYKLPALMDALKKYIEKTNRRISYEYVMLKNINDSPVLAEKLGKLIKGQKCHVNLIPYNETYLGFSNAGKSRIDHFREIVESYGIPVTVRVSLGQDISAACGQLAVEEKRDAQHIQNGTDMVLPRRV